MVGKKSDVLSFLCYLLRFSYVYTGHNVMPCKRYSEDLDQCIVNTLEALRSNAAEGETHDYSTIVLQNILEKNRTKRSLFIQKSIICYYAQNGLFLRNNFI